MKKDEALFQCHHCRKKFKSESRFIRHRCEPMKREERFRTPIGQAAWHYYQTWMKLKKFRVPDDRAFLKSHYYNSFNRFAEFVKKLSLPSPQIFMQLMVDKDYPPTIWLYDQVYVEYLEHLDCRVEPKKHAEITVDTLFKIAEAADVDVSEVFDVVNGSEVIELVRQRRISPWILLPSKKFQQFFVDLKTERPEQSIVLENIIRLKYWATKFDEQPETVRKMKSIVAGLDL